MIRSTAMIPLGTATLLLTVCASPEVMYGPSVAQSMQTAETGDVTPADANTIKSAILASGGRAVLVNIWATWCEPCKREIPALLRLRERFGTRGLELILVSGDFLSDQRRARSFLKTHGVDFQTWIKNQPDREFIAGLVPEWSGSIPATFLFDAGGALRGQWMGEIEPSTVEIALREHLSE